MRQVREGAGLCRGIGAIWGKGVGGRSGGEWEVGQGGRQGGGVDPGAIPQPKSIRLP